MYGLTGKHDASKVMASLGPAKPLTLNGSEGPPSPTLKRQARMRHSPDRQVRASTAKRTARNGARSATLSAEGCNAFFDSINSHLTGRVWATRKRHIEGNVDADLSHSESRY